MEMFEKTTAKGTLQGYPHLPTKLDCLKEQYTCMILYLLKVAGKSKEVFHSMVVCLMVIFTKVESAKKRQRINKSE